jgi:AcrR family transcriptional regulator
VIFLPSKTFMNLPKVKQERILEAAKKEFSEAMFSDVSINRIVKAASISRGSFYMYFSDKHDLLIYLLENFQKQFDQKLKSLGEVAGGNIKKLILGLHDYLFTAIAAEENCNFLTNYFTYSLSASVKNHHQARSMVSSMTKLRESLLEYVDKNQFDKHYEDDLETIIDAHLIILKHTLAKAYLQKTNSKKSRKDLEKLLGILKDGYQKKEEKNA